MRFLKKLVLINSAQIGYADIDLDGNAHFVGTQGAGKSTVLRAILFFYTADTQKLGIGPEKKKFADYYLPHPNSWLVYEVAVGTDFSFMVLVQNREGRIVFRFVRSAYNPDLFLDENKVPIAWSELARKLNHQKIYYLIRQIDGFEEYRQILYGQLEERSNFMLLKSRQYTGITFTLAATFLNASLDASHIKNTIIESVTADAQVIPIDLGAARYNLADIKTRYDDISHFKNKLGQIRKMVSDFRKTLELNELLQTEASVLGTMARHQQYQIKNRQLELEQITEKETQKQTEINNLNRKKETELGQFQKLISGLEIKIEKALSLEKRYAAEGMDQKLALSLQKPDYEIRLKGLILRKQNLVSAADSIEARFEFIRNETEINFSERVNRLVAAYNNWNTGFLEQQNQLKDKHQAHLNKIRQDFDLKLDERRKVLSASEIALLQQEHRLEQIGAQTFLATEIAEQSALIASFLKELEIAQQMLKDNNNQLLVLNKESERERIDLENLQKIERQSFQLQIEQCTEKLTALQQKLNPEADNLFNWLQQNYPNWEANLGKVLAPSVFFAEGINPEKVSFEPDLVFGLKFDLRALPATMANVEGLLKEKANLEMEMARLNAEKNVFEIQASEAQEKLFKKQTEAKRKLNREKEKNEALVNQLKNKHKEALQKLQALELQSEKERNEAIAKETEQLATLRKNKQSAEKVLQNTKNQSNSELLLQEQANAKALQKLQNEKLEKDQLQQQSLEKLESEKLEALTKLEEQRFKALKENKIDTTEISKLEFEIAALENKLTQIDANRDAITRYLADKEEYLDKMEENKTQLQQLNRQLQEITLHFGLQLEELRGQLNTLKEMRYQHLQLLDNLKKDTDKYTQSLNENPILTDLKPYIAEANGSLPAEGRLLMDQVTLLNNTSGQYQSQVNRLLKDLKLFLSKLTFNNYFKLNTQTGPDDYPETCQKLAEMLEADLIDNAMREFAKQISMEVNNLGQQMQKLKRAQADLGKTITDMNREFEQSNFIGVVKSIALRLQNSSNGTISVLERIADYNEKHQHEMGAANLFNAESATEKNRGGFDLLIELLESSRTFGRDRITLADSVELEFRILENNNDTGWIKNMKAVGSNGTDVLVKALVYILLLEIGRKRAGSKLRDYQLHCVIDEVGILHDKNVKALIAFANRFNIWLINGSPNSNHALAYKYTWQFLRDPNTNRTRIIKLLGQR